MVYMHVYVLHTYTHTYIKIMYYMMITWSLIESDGSGGL